MSRKLKQQFRDGDRTEARKALDRVYNASSGFIIIANGDDNKIFARFHNMGVAEIELALQSLDKDTVILEGVELLK